MVGACELIGADVLAVVVGAGEAEPQLLCFTTSGLHPGAGHATLAAAHVAFEHRAAGDDAFSFKLAKGGHRSVRRSPHGIAIDWPLMSFDMTGRGSEIAAALGAEPIESFVAPFGYVAVLATAAEIARLAPDMARTAALDRGALIVTAQGESSDIVIRVFAPAEDLPEDPVCGTAHRIIAPYWAKRLGKAKLHSRQLSKRGGDLWCDVSGGTVTIAGQSVTALEGILHLPD